MKKNLYASLAPCAKEEEVKAEFCKFFKMKIFALRGIDHYTEHVLFEFKYDRNLKNPENVARVLAQVMYYARLLKFGAGLTRYPLPPVICVVDKNEAFFADTKDYARFYAAKGDKYDWDRAPSTPCPKLIGDILASFSLKGNNLNNSKNNFGPAPGATAPGDRIAAPVGAAEKEKVVFTSCPGCFQKKLSPESRAVLAAARTLYRDFYANITRTPWMDWKIETWDVGYYQVRNAMKALGGPASVPAMDGTEPVPPVEAMDGTEPVPPVEALRTAHDALRAKLLPQIYSLGFLNSDVEYFK